MNKYAALKEYLERLLDEKRNEYQEGLKVNGKGIIYLEERKEKIDNIINILISYNYNNINYETLFENLRDVLNFIYNYNNENSNGVEYILEYLRGCVTILQFKDLAEEQVRIARSFIDELVLQLKVTRSNQILKLDKMKQQLELETQNILKYMDILDESGLKRFIEEEEYITLITFIKNSNLEDIDKINLISEINKSNYGYMQKKIEIQRRIILNQISNNVQRILNESDSIGIERQEINEQNLSDNIEELDVVHEEVVLTDEEQEIIELIRNIIDELKMKFDDIQGYQVPSLDDLVTNGEYIIDVRIAIYESILQEKWKTILYDLLNNLRVECISNLENKDNILSIYKYIIAEYQKIKERENIQIPSLSKEEFEQIQNLFEDIKDIIDEFNGLSISEKNLIKTIYDNRGEIKSEYISPKYSLSYACVIGDYLSLVRLLDDYNQHIDVIQKLSIDESPEPYIESLNELIEAIKDVYKRLSLEYSVVKKEQEDIQESKVNASSNDDEDDLITSEDIDLNLLPLEEQTNYIIFLDELLDVEFKMDDFFEIMDKEKDTINSVASSLNRLYKKDGNLFQTNSYGLSEKILGSDFFNPRATRTGTARTGFIVVSVSNENKERIFRALNNSKVNGKEFKNSRIFLVIGYVRKYGNKEIYQTKFNARISKCHDKIKEFQDMLKDRTLTDEEVTKVVSMIGSSYKHVEDLIEEYKKNKRRGS